MTAPPEKSASVTQKIGSFSFKISDDLFSHHPIFIDQSLQHTGFAPLFTKLTNEVPHFAPPLQIVLLLNIICPPSLHNIYPNFRSLIRKRFKKTSLVTDFAPPLALRPGTIAHPPPPYAT